MCVDEEAVPRQLAHAPRQELPEGHDDPEVGVERAQPLDEGGVAGPIGAPGRDPGALGRRRDRRGREPLPAPARAVGLGDRRHDGVRTGEQALEGRHGKGGRTEDEELQKRVAGRAGGRSPAVGQESPSSRSAFLRFCT